MTKRNKPTLVDTLILALMIVLLMIGSHQVYLIGQTEGFRNGFFKSYYIFMIIVLLMAVYQMRKNKRLKDQISESSNTSEKTIEKKNVKTGKK